MKYTRFLLITCLIFGMLILPSAVFADDDTSTTDTVNVALGKTVISGNPNYTNKQAGLLVDGILTDANFVYSYGNSNGAYKAGTKVLFSGKEIPSATHQSNDWFIVDLGKPYKITEVKLWGRTPYYYRFMRYFDIEASNDEEFSTKVKLGGLGNHEDLTYAKSPFVAKGDGNYYQYVRIRKTGNTEHGYKELEVFVAVPRADKAEMNGKKITVSFTDAMNESTIENGLSVEINGKPAEDIYFEMTDEYTLEIDLGKQYFDSQIKILLTDDIENQDGLGLKEKVFDLYSPKALEVSVNWQNAKTETGSAIEAVSDAVEAGEIGAQVSFVNNTSSQSADSVVIAVLYDENNYIVAADEKRITVDALKDGSITAGFELPAEVTLENAENYKMSVFVWQDYSLMKPWIPKMTLGE